MNQQYITAFEVYIDGEKTGNGNQSLRMEGGPEAPDAIEFLKAVKEHAAKQSKCEPENIYIVGIFKL